MGCGIADFGLLILRCLETSKTQKFWSRNPDSSHRLRKLNACLPDFIIFQLSKVAHIRNSCQRYQNRISCRIFLAKYSTAGFLSLAWVVSVFKWIVSIYCDNPIFWNWIPGWGFTFQMNWPVKVEIKNITYPRNFSLLDITAWLFWNIHPPIHL